MENVPLHVKVAQELVRQIVDGAVEDVMGVVQVHVFLLVMAHVLVAALLVVGQDVVTSFILINGTS